MSDIQRYSDKELEEPANSEVSERKKPWPKSYGVRKEVSSTARDSQLAARLPVRTTPCQSPEMPNGPIIGSNQHSALPLIGTNNPADVAGSSPEVGSHRRPCGTGAAPLACRFPR
jgi:hypothetical protein